MPTFTLPSKPAIVAAIATGTVARVSDRIADLMTRQGYVLGPGRIAINGDGRVTVDVDRDPSADWAQFDPATPLAAETAAANLKTQAKAARTQLQADLAILAGTPTAAQQKAIMTDVVTYLDKVIGVLDNAGVLS
jgi:hypothetical protein